MSVGEKKLAKFSLGTIVGTPGALKLLAKHHVAPSELLDRHVTGDWGDLDDEDKSVNEAALRDGSRIFSAYKLGEGEDDKVWIVTEAKDDNGNRSASTLLLPSEY